LTRPGSLGGYALGPNEPQAIDAQRKLDKVIAEKNRLQQLTATRSDRWNAAGQLRRAVFDFLRDKSDAWFEVVADAPLEKLLSNGESISAAVTRYRSKLAGIVEKLERVCSAPWPSKLAIERATQQIAALAAAPDCARAISRGEPISFATETVKSMMHGPAPALAHAEVVNFTGAFLLDVSGRADGQDHRRDQTGGEG
jgi:hypothetical protein